jgi:hypothetical protein
LILNGIRELRRDQVAAHRKQQKRSGKTDSRERVRALAAGG